MENTTKKKRNRLPWNEAYQYAKKYYEVHGNLKVPRNFVTSDGYSFDSNGKFRLGEWVFNQKSLTPKDSERGKLLSLIGFNFEYKYRKIKWEDGYQYAKKYYEMHGHLKVPFDFVTNDGYTYNPEGKIRLGKWIFNQKSIISKNREKGKLLALIGMRLPKKINNLSWEEMYNYAKKYCEVHGNIDVPRVFRTDDGYTYNHDGEIDLGSWIYYQRKVVSQNSEKGKLLSLLGMRFYKKYTIISWEEMYNYAKKYYEVHGNLRILSTFKTNDGFTYDPDGKIHLGLWIFNQRHKTPKDSERGLMLSKIGMIWNFEENKKKVQDLCIKYGIDYQKNKALLDNISIDILEARVQFLGKQNDLLMKNDILNDNYSFFEEDKPLVRKR